MRDDGMMRRIRRDLRKGLKKMSDYRPVQYFNFASMPAVPFDITSLKSETVVKLFQETKSYIGGVKIEVITNGKNSRGREEHPAATIGVNVHSPTILFVESLDKEQRIEAISHELGHLLLVYRFGLGLVGLRIPHRENSQEAFRFFSNIKESWFYLLGQIPNTIHHLVLVGFLKEGYGITSSRHAHFLQRHFQNSGDEGSKDKELLYARGLAAFEYGKLVGPIERVINIKSQSELFWKAYDSAQKCFGDYSFSSIPTPSDYKENILSFLESFGYRKEDFMFFPKDVSDDREKGVG
jgi:hypothetical protein